MDSPNEISLEEIIGNIVGGVEIPPIGKSAYLKFFCSFVDENKKINCASPSVVQIVC